MTIKIQELLNKEIYNLDGRYVGKLYDAMIDLEKNAISGIVVSDVINGQFKNNISDASKKVIIPYNSISAIGNIVLLKTMI